MLGTVVSPLRSDLVRVLATDCSDEDNNNGITIVDITDPENPAYCFIRHEHGKPLNALEYLHKNGFGATQLAVLDAVDLSTYNDDEEGGLSLSVQLV